MQYHTHTHTKKAKDNYSHINLLEVELHWSTGDKQLRIKCRRLNEPAGKSIKTISKPACLCVTLNCFFLLLHTITPAHQSPQTLQHSSSVHLAQRFITCSPQALEIGSFLIVSHNYSNLSNLLKPCSIPAGCTMPRDLSLTGT